MSFHYPLGHRVNSLIQYPETKAWRLGAPEFFRLQLFLFLPPRPKSTGRILKNWRNCHYPVLSARTGFAFAGYTLSIVNSCEMMSVVL